MCSACAIIRPRSSKSAVEQSRRSLMFGEKAPADEHGAHLLGDRPQLGAEHLQLDVHRSSTSVPFASERPCHPSGTQQVAPGSSTSAGPATSRRSALEPQLRPRPDLGRPHCDQLELALRLGVAVALLVRGVERARPGSARAAPSARTTGRGSAARPRPPPEARLPPSSGRTCVVTRSRRSSLAARPSAESTPACSGTSTRETPSSSASAQACSGPAPPKATSAKPRGSWPRSTETTRSALSISAFTTSITAGGSIPSSARSAASRSSSIPPASVAGSRPSRRFASVTVGSRAAAPVAGRPGIGARALAARRAARRRGRARRSSRRRRRRCGCRPSAAARAARRPSARSERRPAARDQADVGRRAAHVEGDRVLDPGRARDARRADDAPGRPGDEDERRRARPPPRASPPRPTSASRAARAGPRRAQRAPQRPQVARGDRAEVGVGGGRRGALVLAELGRDLVRGDDVRAG